MSAAYRCVDYLSFCEKVGGFRPVETASPGTPGRKAFNRVDRRRIGEWFFGGKIKNNVVKEGHDESGTRQSFGTTLCVRGSFV